MADTDEKKGRGRPKKSEGGEKRPKEDTSDEPKAKRGRGRPKGSSKKGKKAAAKTGGSPKKSTGRGRPRKPEADKDTGSDDAGDQSD